MKGVIIMKIYRHGDLLIKEVTSIPNGSIKQKDNIVAEGEFTGHHHVLIADKEDEIMVEILEGIKYLRLNKTTTITHPEHKEIELPKGDYVIQIEREYDPFEQAVKQVKD